MAATACQVWLLLMRRIMTRLLGLGLLVVILIPSACSSDDDDAGVGGAGSGGGGSGSGTTSGGVAQAGTSAGHSTAGGSVSGSLSAVGGDVAAGGGAAAGGDAGAGASGGGESSLSGASGVGGAPEATECVFHTSASGEAAAGAGGAGGAGGAPAADVRVAASRTIGPYLTDAEGHTLYIFGSDVPGDCQAPPIGGCSPTCIQTWSIFHAGARVLDDELNDEQFGDFALPPPTSLEQTTYHGWPLYRYVGEAPGSLSGQGIATLWHAVTIPFFNVMLMKKKLSQNETVKYISDGEGFALYRSAADPVPVPGKPARSQCIGACRKDWPPFSLDRFILPSSYASSDFSLFLRQDGELQVAYRGMPLYRAAKDQKPGDTLGHGVEGFTLADPAL